MRLMKLGLAIVNNQLGTVPKPSWCTYLVCYRCNARCKMCDSWRVKPGTEMTPEEVRLVFKKIGTLDVVRLSGGEPFLREDMVEVAVAVLEESAPSVIHITSNGSFPDRMEDFVRRFPDPKRLRFMISFDGLEEEHDINRGAEVTFKTAIEAVGRLSKMRKSYGIHVSVNHTVISKQSLEDHPTLQKIFAPLNVDIHSVLAYSDTAMYGIKRRGKKSEDLISSTGYPLHEKLKDADCIGFVKQQLKDLSKLNDPVLRIGKKYYLKGLLARLQKQANPKPKPKCVALRSHIRLLPDGSVPVCQFNTEKMGNLVTQSFDEVWHNQKTKESRQWVDDCPGCWAECEVMPNAIFSGDLGTKLIS
ncbi:MAG: radical SAM protein [Gemmataceae bacterium]